MNCHVCRYATHVHVAFLKCNVCRYATHVHEALTALVADPDQEVRRLMALQFHDICKMLGKERCAQYMKRYSCWTCLHSFHVCSG